MDVQEKLGALFPAADDIPAEFNLAEPITQEVYLADGELKPWDGPWQDVFSPVHLDRGGGSGAQVPGPLPAHAHGHG